VVIGGRRSSGARWPAGFERLAEYAGRGVVTTATYAAREFGVHSGMALMHAARLCPQRCCCRRLEQYRHYSRLFKSAVRALAPRMEDRGIDEVYLDFDAAPGGTEQGGRTLASQIQQAVRASTA